MAEVEEAVHVGVGEGAEELAGLGLACLVFLLVRGGGAGFGEREGSGSGSGREKVREEVEVRRRRTERTTKSAAVNQNSLSLSSPLTFAGGVRLEDLLGLPAGLRLLLDRQKEVAAGRGGSAGSGRGLSVFLTQVGFAIDRMGELHDVAVFRRQDSDILIQLAYPGIKPSYTHLSKVSNVA